MQFITTVILSSALLVAACGEDTSLGLDAGAAAAMVADGAALDAATADSGPQVLQCSWPGSSGRPDLDSNRTSADGCNECHCGTTAEGVSIVFCTTGLCQVSVVRCSAHSECGEWGFCHFDPGCSGELGWCTQGYSGCAGENPVAGPTATGVICGCGGVTREGGPCLGKPWRHRGPC